MPRAAGNTIILCLLVFIVYITFHDYHDIIFGAHSVAQLKQQIQDTFNHDSTAPALVVASKSSDNTSWLYTDSLPWQKKIYVVDDSHAALHVPQNKGRESMVYLTYV